VKSEPSEPRHTNSGVDQGQKLEFRKRDQGRNAFIVDVWIFFQVKVGQCVSEGNNMEQPKSDVNTMLL
jgi:hypothetical protein